MTKDTNPRSRDYSAIIGQTSHQDLWRMFSSGSGPFESEILGRWHGKWGPWASDSPWWLKFGCRILLRGWLGKTFYMPSNPRCPHNEEVLRRGVNLFRSGSNRYHFSWGNEWTDPSGRNDLAEAERGSCRLRLDYSQWPSAMSRVRDDLRMIVSGRPARDGSAPGLMLGRIYWRMPDGDYMFVRWFWLWR